MSWSDQNVAELETPEQKRELLDFISGLVGRARRSRYARRRTPVYATEVSEAYDEYVNRGEARPLAISSEFVEFATMADAAEHLGVKPPYLSQLFRKLRRETEKNPATEQAITVRGVTLCLAEDLGDIG